MKQIFSFSWWNAVLTRRTAVFLITLALAIGFVTRFMTVFRYVDFQDDQAWSATQILSMKQGHWPALGPFVSVSDFRVPPLYYYVAFPFTYLFGGSPVGPAFANVFFSWLSIPLLMLVVYIFLEHLPKERRLLLVGMSGLWWSVFFPDILLNNVGWNPSMIPFFLLASALLFYFIMRKPSRRAQLLLWAGSGVVLAIFTGLHPTTLFVMPIAYIPLSLWFILKNKRRWFFPLFGAAVAIVMLAPYWKGEITTHWENTRRIVHMLKASSSEHHTILEQVDRAAFNYLELGPLAYFPGVSSQSLSPIILAGLLLLALAYFRGNKELAIFFGVTFFCYAVATSNYWQTFFIHYKAVIWFLPIGLSAVVLGNLSAKDYRQRIIGILVVATMLLSVGANAAVVARYVDAKFGRERLMTTNDIVRAFKVIPVGATVCVHPDEVQADTFLATFTLKKDLVFTTSCMPGDYQILPVCIRQDQYLASPRCTRPAVPEDAVTVTAAKTYALFRYR